MQQRTRNPFRFGGPVPHTHFIGRESIIGNCYKWLSGPEPTSIAISGEHGIGKTSLLRYLMHIAQQEGWSSPDTQGISIFLDCQTIRPFTTTLFWRRVLEELRQVGLKRVLRRKIASVLKQPELDDVHIRQLLRELNIHQFSLTLYLDSFAWIVRSQSDNTMIAGFLASLRSLGSQPDYSLTLITATREPLDILCADIVEDYPEAAFYNDFIFQSLGPFTLDEITVLLEQAQRESNEEFDRSFRDFLLRIAGPHPALLQMAGFYLFEASREGSLSTRVRKKAIYDLEQAACDYFSLFWEQSSPLERTLFVLLILQQLMQRTSLPVELTREQINALLNRFERNLLQLINRGLVRLIDDSYQIASVVFVQWIVRKLAAGYDETLRDDSLLHYTDDEVVQDALLR